MTHLEKEYILYRIKNEYGKDPLRERIGRSFRKKCEYKKFIREQTDPDEMYEIRWEVQKTYVKRWDR